MADSLIYSHEESDSETGSEISVEGPPAIPSIIANWYLNENLGSGYSGQ